jgi:hypothetical protein
VVIVSEAQKDRFREVLRFAMAMFWPRIRNAMASPIRRFSPWSRSPASRKRRLASTSNRASSPIPFTSFLCGILTPSIPTPPPFISSASPTAIPSSKRSPLPKARIPKPTPKKAARPTSSRRNSWTSGSFRQRLRKGTASPHITLKGPWSTSSAQETKATRISHPRPSRTMSNLRSGRSRSSSSMRRPSGWKRSSIPTWRSFSNIEICRWPFTFETCSSNLDEQVSDSEESANSKNQMAKRNLQNRSNFDLRCIWALMYDNGLEVLYV